MVEEYLVSHHKTDILKILEDDDNKKHYSLNINFIELFEYDTNLGNNILKNADEALEELDQWILHIQNILVEQAEDATSLTLKLYIHARIYGLPACPELHRNVFPKNDDLGLFLQVTGTIVRVTTTKMLEYQRPYICTKCKYTVTIEAVYDQKYIILPPKKCDECSGKNLISVGDLNADNCKDYQEVKIQEQSSKLGVGSMPSSMWVTLEDDLVDACKPGDDVTICGTVKRRWGSLVSGKRIEVELVLKSNHIQVNNGQSSPSLITPEIREQFTSFWEKYKSNPLEGRDLILKSFSPKLYGMHMVKLAVAVVLAGGTHCKQGNEVGIQIRSEPHILLVGDPGTGKSQLLRYAAKIIPRSVLTTGVGTTSAGLTVAAIMEDGQWQLEGGALVLADGGICCIDEFNSMKSHDRASIHEAMEQQTISVAKASMVCKLRTRCSILAATNPKGGHLDPSQPLSLNLALPSPLLSRFDIILMLKDAFDTEWDNLIADHILSGKGINSMKIDGSFWSLETLQQYFTIIRSLNPKLTPTTNQILSCYYQAQRRASSRNKARTTVRLLDSLVRLSQAHARLMFHHEVQIMDALFAVVLIENSMHGECAVLSLDKVNIQAPFVTNPMENYARIAVSMLGQLGLQDILKDEITALSNGYRYEPTVSSIGDEPTLSTSVSDKTCSVFDETAPNISLRNREMQFNSVHQNFEIIENNNVNEGLESKIGKASIKSNYLINKELARIEGKKITENITCNISNDSTKDNATKHENRNSDSAQQNVEVAEKTDTGENPKQKSIKRNIPSKTEKENYELLDEENTYKTNRGKKRKYSKPDQQPKTSKGVKNKSELNDFQMLNLIRSANDDFDISILNFTSSEDLNLQSSDITEKNKSMFEHEPVISQTTKIRQEIREKFSFKPKIQPHLKIDNNNINNNNLDVIENLDINNENVSIEVDAAAASSSECRNVTESPTLTGKDTEISEAMCVNKNKNEELTENSESNNRNNLVNECAVDIHKEMAPHNKKNVESSELTQQKAAKLSQNTKFKQFREKFSFRPIDHSRKGQIEETGEKNCENPDIPKNVKASTSDSINNLQVPVFQSLFKSQDQDYDSLDLDF